MFKILYIVSTLRKTGPISQLYEIVKYLDRSIYEPIILTLSPEGEFSMLDEFVQLGISVYPLNFSRVEMVLKGIREIVVNIKKIAPDLIHSSGFRSDLICSSLKVGIPVISTGHNYPLADYSTKYGCLFGNILAMLHLRALDKMPYVVLVSKSLQKKIYAKYKLKFDCIRNGVDEKLFSNVEGRSKRELRKKMDIPVDKLIFVFSGSLSNLKGVSMLIDVFALRNDNAMLLVLGGGPLEKMLRVKYKENSNNIKFLGKVKRVLEYLQLSDYYISASFSEGLPMSVIEAMSCGLPCVLSDIEAHKEILSLHGKSGIIFTKGKKQSLCSAVTEIQDYDYREMSLAARKTVEKFLTARNMSEKYQDLYCKILSEGR